MLNSRKKLLIQDVKYLRTSFWMFNKKTFNFLLQLAIKLAYHWYLIERLDFSYEDLICNFSHWTHNGHSG